MLFKFLEKPIEITAIVSSKFAFAHEYFPINYSSKFIPNWWKKTPIGQWNFEQWNINSTVKSCIGIIGTFQNGFILPLHCDLSIKLYEDGSWRYQFSDQLSGIENHPNEQIPSFYEDYYYLKLYSPWVLKTSEEMKFIFCDPFYMSSKKNNYIIPYAIPRTVSKTISTNIFLMVEKKPIEIFIDCGTPMLHIIPITERPIKFKREVVSAEEWHKIVNTHTKISFASRGLKILNELRKQKNG